MQILKKLMVLMTGLAFMFSCTAPVYLTPNIQETYLSNQGTFSIQNLDETAKIEPQSLIAHYADFDMKYKISDSFVVSFEIINNTNKSMIIDKSKCYVLYNGYSTDLFKDVRSSRSTTFNNVQDAINNVQTSDASITMTIPPYSKWVLPTSESNIRNIKTPDFIEQTGLHPMQVYDNPEPVEFVIPYTFDYSLTKWYTSRNRVYIGQIVTNETTATTNLSIYKMKDATTYEITKRYLDSTFNKAEAERINNLNILSWKKFRHRFNLLMAITVPTIILSPIVPLTMADVMPPIIYNSDGTPCEIYPRAYYKKNYNAAY